jgi:hypothetical protein
VCGGDPAAEGGLEWVTVCHLSIWCALRVVFTFFCRIEVNTVVFVDIASVNGAVFIFINEPTREE